jgi:hypothetical protein
MSEMRYEVKVTAIGEVRDKHGNLLSAEPVELVQTMSESELRTFSEGERQ